MAHDIDETTGAPAIAYWGDTPWHKLGTVGKQEWSLDEWIDAARVGYEVIRVPALAHTGELPSQGAINGVAPVTGAYFNVRSDTGAILGTQTHTDRRVEVQPREIFKFVWDYLSVDDRFKLEVIGAVRRGAQVWATASFNGEYEVAGERHKSFIIARTGFDGSLATHFYTTHVRGVCKNTLAAGWDKRAMVSIRHTQKFNSAMAAKQLAAMAQSVESYQAIGNALADANMAQAQVADFFRDILDIRRDEKWGDISTRKQNQYQDVARAYIKSQEEGAPTGSAWAALQAVTRYVDHERSTRNTNGDENEAQFMSSQFGSGAALKGKAMGLLMPLIKDKVPVLA